MALPRRRQDLGSLNRHLRQTGPSSTMNAARSLVERRSEPSSNRFDVSWPKRFDACSHHSTTRTPWTTLTPPTGRSPQRAQELLDQLTPAERLGPAAPARRPRPPGRARAVPHGHRRAARRRVARDGDHVPAARRARGHVGRGPAGTRRRGRRHRGPGQARGRPDRLAQRVGARRQPAAAPAVGPQRGRVLRGPAPHRAPRHRVRPGPARRPPDLLAHGPDAQAPRRLRERDRPQRHQRAAVPPGAARVRAAGVPRPDRGRRGRGGDAVVQPGQRPPQPRRPRAARRGPRLDARRRCSSSRTPARPPTWWSASGTTTTTSRPPPLLSGPASTRSPTTTPTRPGRSRT